MMYVCMMHVLCVEAPMELCVQLHNQYRAPGDRLRGTIYVSYPSYDATSQRPSQPSSSASAAASVAAVDALWLTINGTCIMDRTRMNLSALIPSSSSSSSTIPSSNQSLFTSGRVIIADKFVWSSHITYSCSIMLSGMRCLLHVLNAMMGVI